MERQPAPPPAADPTTRVERFTRGTDLAWVAQLLTEHRHEILSRWLAAASSQPFHAEQPERAVADDVPRLFDALTDLLRRAAPRAVASGAPLEDPAVLQAARDHSRARLEQGLQPADVVAEFRLLRQEVGRALRYYLPDEAPLSDVVGAEMLVHDALDGAIALALAALTRQLGTAMRELREEIAERQRTAHEQMHLLDLAHDAILVRRFGSGTITFWNRGAEALYGWSPADALDCAFHELLQTRATQPLDAIEMSVVETGRWDGELISTTRDGRQLVVASRWALKRDLAGQPESILEIDRDVTAQRAAEEELRSLNIALERRVDERTAALTANEARTRAIVETALDSIITIDQEGRFVEFNPAAERAFGYRRDDVLGRPLAALIIPERLRAAHEASLAHYLATGDGPLLGKQVEMPALRADGTEILVELAIVRIATPDSRGALFTAYLRDITERKRTEQEREALLAAERTAHAAADDARQRAAFLAEATSILSGSLDHEINFATLANLVVPRVADWCAVDLLGDDGTLRRVAVAHSDPTKAKLAWELHRRYPPQSDAQHGVPRVLRSGDAELHPQLPDAILEAVARDAEHMAILRTLGLRSSMIVPLPARNRMLGAITFVTAESGRSFGPDDIAMAEDLGRHAALAIDNALLYEQVQEALRTRDAFLGSAAHDLRSPLTAFRGMAQLLHRQLTRTLPPESAEPFLPRIDQMLTATDRMTGMLEELLDITRLQMGQPLALARRPTDLVGLALQRAAEHQQRTGQHHIRVTTTVQRLVGDWDTARLERLLDNLLSNAIKYSPRGGEITVGVDSESRDDLPWAILSVRDRGIGIPAAELPGLFQRFRRASNAVGVGIRGTGLGLASARQIAEQHGGTLSIESQEGVGSTFTVRLPLAWSEPHP